MWAVINAGFRKISLPVACRIDEGKSLKTGSCQEAVRVILA